MTSLPTNIMSTYFPIREPKIFPMLYSPNEDITPPLKSVTGGAFDSDIISYKSKDLKFLLSSY